MDNATTQKETEMKWTTMRDGCGTSSDMRFQIRTYVDTMCPSRPGGKGRPNIFFVADRETGATEWMLSIAKARRWAEAR